MKKTFLILSCLLACSVFSQSIKTKILVRGDGTMLSTDDRKESKTIQKFLSDPMNKSYQKDYEDFIQFTQSSDLLPLISDNVKKLSDLLTSRGDVQEKKELTKLIESYSRPTLILVYHSPKLTASIKYNESIGFVGSQNVSIPEISLIAMSKEYSRIRRLILSSKKLAAKEKVEGTASRVDTKVDNSDRGLTLKDSSTNKNEDLKASTAIEM